MGGTRLAVEQVIREHFVRIHRAALILTGNPWDADDLAQETFLVFASQYHRFAGQSSLYTWLYGILLNLERRERRRRTRRHRRLLEWRSRRQTWPQDDQPAGYELQWTEWQRTLWAMVAKLPAGQREALVLRFSEGLRYEEIATILGCPVGTVKSRIFHGLISLRRQCQEANLSSDVIS